MQALLALSIGPVQDFIAAARRTADLQAGSELLVEIARAAARAVEQCDGQLIFPARSDLDGPNKILAVVPGSRAAEAARQARAAVQQVLRRRWEQLRADLPRDVLDTALAGRQIEQFPEVYAAWVPLPASAAAYPEARQEVDLLLAGRKALREFAPPPEQPGRPKSPLDPSRDCVLHCGRDLSVPESCRRYPLWLKKRETLDAVSLLKRLMGAKSPGKVPSTSLLAARAILPAVRDRAGDVLKELEQLADRAGAGVDVGDLFFPGRLEELEPEEREKLDEARTADLRRKALKAAGRSEAPPYYAILVADGDRMGRLVRRQPDIAAHRRLSETLAQFSRAALDLVASHDGHPVYSGGDDVLALLPANQALRCAAQLSARFRQLLAPFAQEDTGTLSVGIAVVHYLEPLQTSVARARDAEKVAKQERNSLAVALHTRGGSPTIVTHRWSEDPDLTAWQSLLRAMQGEVARGLPYELRELAREFSAPGMPVHRLRAEAERIIRRKEGGDQFTLPPKVTDPESMCRFSDQMVVARFLAGLEVRS